MAAEEDAGAEVRALAGRSLAFFARHGCPREFGAETARFLDGFVEANRPLPEEALGNLTAMVGAVLGECIVASYGGAWAEVEGVWAVAFDERNAVFPFARARGQWERGAEDSVLSMYEMIPHVFGHRVRRPGDPVN